MQAISVTNSTTFAICSVPRNDSKFLNRCYTTNSFINGASLWRHCFSMGRSKQKWRKGSSAVRATWLFNRKNDDDEETRGASLERSEAANEDIVIFFFQLDLATRVQCALNMEQYDAAKQLRNKLTEVETEIVKQRDAKRGSSSKSEVQDKAITLLRLRADLQKAVGNENYAVAAELRDQISKLEAESLAASAKALAFENVQYAFRLGQKVRHKTFGYRAIICGMDPVCCESSSWMEVTQVNKLLQGPNQPFYQVLVDVHADPNLLVAYDIEAATGEVNPTEEDMAYFQALVEQQ